MIDLIKDYWNNRPCNINHSKKTLGSLEYFNEVDKKRYFVEPHILKFADFKNQNNKKVLELGCGIGTDSIRFAQAGAILTAVDLSDKSIEITKQRFKTYNFLCSLHCGNIEELSKFVPVSSYDLIYSFGVIHHTENPNNVLEEIKKYCNKNTTIKIMVYNKYSWKAITFFLLYGYKFLFNYEKTIQYFAEAQLNCPRAIVYSKKSLKEFLKDFEIIKITKDHIFVYNIKEYIKGNYKKIWYFKLIPNFIFNWFKQIFGWHYLIEMKIKQ
jgi:2-polyprenyl-3-methyl-5-hydroxy-6-metoxy-1,4-benzoquinol methylase